MKAIIIAAGRGKRLGAHTAEVPKTLVPVGARTMLGWQMRAFAAAGVDELVLIRGYRGDVLEAGARAEAPPGVRLTFVDNPEWETNNILLSLACARAALDGPTLITYSDIIFTPSVVRALMAGRGPIDLVIDADFRDIYEGRTEHPLDEGEVSDLDLAGRVRRVGKRALPPAEAHGEFIGLARLDAAGAAIVGAALDDLAARYRGRDHEPFQRAARYRNAYLTDLWQELIDGGTPIHPVTIHGQWREIDTGQDLARAIALVESTSEEWS
ncbi:MAG: phosphocholine cytidylyltransferase family protein [Myxococcales bacterium]|nr:phosphocholine cytidylyltransferase family protein [Myxococcales bacterium]MBK7198077.1 phosphocholine cytidylyltransferase family protein [Myxococcales bacterium]MBP6845296.1 phosphocholine cytidylyltransferase family protein [Kofleriaceae bacterium]